MPINIRSAPVSVLPSSFEDAATVTVHLLRTSLTELLAVMAEPAPRPVDLERILGIDKKLAWQVFRLVNSEGLGEVVNIPSRPSMRRLLNAAESCGVPDPAIRAVADALERFESFAAAHGGDRQGLISMIAGIGGQRSEQYEQKIRRSLFRANAHVWGVQARMQVRTMIHQEGSAGEGRGVLVAGDIGLQRLHPGRPLAVSAWLRSRLDETREDVHPVPLSPAAEEGVEERAAANPPAPPGPGGPELLLDYCSRPLPEMVPQPGIAGKIETEMVFPAMGRAGAVTLYMTHSATTGEDTRRTVQGVRMFIAIPAEEVVCDLVVPSGWTDPASARVAIYGRRHNPEHVYDERKIDLFPQRETVAYFGGVEIVPAIAGAPHHQSALRDILARHGWFGKRFDVYRCRVEYPILHTLLTLKVDPART
jgi:hypothetical protein